MPPFHPARLFDNYLHFELPQLPRLPEFSLPRLPELVLPNIPLFNVEEGDPLDRLCLIRLVRIDGHIIERGTFDPILLDYKDAAFMAGYEAFFVKFQEEERILWDGDFKCISYRQWQKLEAAIEKGFANTYPTAWEHLLSDD